MAKNPFTRLKSHRLSSEHNLIRELKLLKDARKARTRGAIKGAAIAASTTAITELATNPSFREGFTLMAGATLAGAAGGALWASTKKHPSLVKRAIKLIGLGLYQQAYYSKALREELQSVKYIYIKGNGEIILTNRPRIAGIGRLRLETSKIFSEGYL